MRFDDKGRSKTCILVLGMHRSGTSAFTRLVSLLGADLPATLLGGREANLASNAKGHWESEVLARLNDRILESAGNSWKSPELIPDVWYRSARFEEFREEALKLLNSEFGTSSLFVFKDPRVCKLVPFWTTVLKDFGADTVVANMLRKPTEVGKSLEARNGFDPTLSELLWLRYVLEAERQSRQFSRLHVTYDGLLADCQGVIDTVVASADVCWPAVSAARRKEISNFISTSERHHHEAGRNVSAGTISLWSQNVYEIYEKWADEGEDPRDHKALDGIYWELDALLKQFMGPIMVAFEKTITVYKLQKLREQQTETIESHLRLFQSEEASITELMIAEGLDVEFADGHLSKSKLPGNKLETTQPNLIVERVQFLIDKIKQRERDKLAAAQALIAQNLAETALQDSRIEAFKNELKLLRDDNAQAMELNAQLQGESTSTVSQVQDLRLELSEARAEMLAERNALEAQIALNERQIKKFRAKTDEAAATRRKDFASQLINLENRIKEVLAQADASKAEIARLRNVNAQILEKKNNALAALADVRDNRAMRINAFRTQIGAFRREIDVLNGVVSAMRGEILMHEHREGKLALDLSSYQNRYEDDILNKFEQSHGDHASFLSRARAFLRRSAYDREAALTDLLRESALFDEEYYLSLNPDVSKSAIDPAQHYVKFGAKEGRNPSAQFDGRKYLARYQDVASSGINPLVHYLTKGRRENRKAEAVSDPSVGRRQKKNSDLSVKPAAPCDRDDSEDVNRTLVLSDISPEFSPTIAQTATKPAWPKEPVLEDNSLIPPVAAIVGSDAVHQPFTALASEAKDWIQSLAIANVGAVDVGKIRIGVTDQPMTPLLSSTLKLFDTLRSVDVKVDCTDLVDQMVRTDLAGGHIAITNAWLSSDRELNVFLVNAGTNSLVIRICQASAAGEPVLCFEGLIDAQGSLHAHVYLADRFEPILVIVTSAHGQLRDASLLPFPSMFRGGLHYAELVDHMVDHPAGQDWLEGYREYSVQILAKQLDRSRNLAISYIAVDTAAALGCEAIFAQDLQHWLARRFGIGITASGSGAISELIVETQGFGQGSADFTAQRMTGCSLSLPASAIPTLAVLVASKTDLTSASAFRSVIRTDLAMRPSRSIMRPAAAGEFGRDFQTTATPPVDDGRVWTGKASLAISLNTSSRAPKDVRAVFPIAPDGALPPELKPDSATADISVIIHCSGDRTRLKSLLLSLRMQTLVTCDDIILVGNVHADDATPDRVLGPTISELTVSSLDQAIRTAGHSLILLLDDELTLHDRRTLGVLAALAQVENVGSVGCQFVHGGERDKHNKDFELSFAWTPVTLRSGERFLAQPTINPSDLPPVVAVAANRVRCMMIRKESWLLSVDATVDADAFIDLALGDALRVAGYRSIATGLISVGDLRSRSHSVSFVAIDSPLNHAVMSLREF